MYKSRSLIKIYSQQFKCILLGPQQALLVVASMPLMAVVVVVGSLQRITLGMVLARDPCDMAGKNCTDHMILSKKFDFGNQNT